MVHPLLAVAALALATAPQSQESRPTQPARGPTEELWEGTLDVGGVPIRLALHVKPGPRTASGKRTNLVATLDSLDQGARGIPVDVVTFNAPKVEFLIKALGASFSGALSKDGNAIEGTFTQGGARPLTFKRVEKLSELAHPQNPKPPFPYREVAVAFSHEPGKPVRDSFQPRAAKDDTTRVTLSGTLTLPEGAGPFPAAVLVTGSGPQNRDEELLGHKPFLVIADHLARRGIAVLRYDDRGVAESTGIFAAGTSQDFADDAEAAVLFLATRPEISHKKIGIVGHSEGGLIAPLVASRPEIVRSENVGFIVLLAGPGVDGTAILRLQSHRIAELLGADPGALAKVEPLREKLMSLARDGADTKETADEMRALLAKITELEAPKEGAAPGAADAELREIRTPWFRFFLSLDPAVALRKVRCPVLAMNGALDSQVVPQQNLPEIARALAEGSNPDWQIVELPGLNHLFQECKTGSPAEYAQIEQTFSPRALTLLSDWILAHAH